MPRVGGSPYVPCDRQTAAQHACHRQERRLPDPQGRTGWAWPEPSASRRAIRWATMTALVKSSFHLAASDRALRSSASSPDAAACRKKVPGCA